MYDTIYEIMELAKCSQKGCMKNVLEKFHVQLHIYVFLKYSNGL